MRRVRIGPGGVLLLGPGDGRGAWLCDEITCLESAERRRAFSRTLRADVKRSEIDRLRAACARSSGEAA